MEENNEGCRYCLVVIDDYSKNGRGIALKFKIKNIQTIKDQISGFVFLK